MKEIKEGMSCFFVDRYVEAVTSAKFKNWKREKTRTERKLKENKCSPIQSIIRKHFVDDLL